MRFRPLRLDSLSTVSRRLFLLYIHTSSLAGRPAAIGRMRPSISDTSKPAATMPYRRRISRRPLPLRFERRHFIPSRFSPSTGEASMPRYHAARARRSISPFSAKRKIAMTLRLLASALPYMYDLFTIFTFLFSAGKSAVPSALHYACNKRHFLVPAGRLPF